MSCCAYNHVQKRPLNLAKLFSERQRLRNRFCESLKLAQLKLLNRPDPGINAAVNVSWTVQHSMACMLMTCKVRILCPDRSTMQARALVDSVSSTSFITEHLAQLLGLKQKQVNINMSGIEGNLSSLSPQLGVGKFQNYFSEMQSKTFSSSTNHCAAQGHLLSPIKPHFMLLCLPGRSTGCCSKKGIFVFYSLPPIWKMS